MACLHWHYSKCTPAGKLVKVGVWEDGVFVGAVIFSRGANAHIGEPYGLKQIKVCELTRVALTQHKATVSRILSIAIRMVKKHCPGLRLIVSYADTEQNHHGGIYQASNWLYCGQIISTPKVVYQGRVRHMRSVTSIRGTAIGLPNLPPTFKHKYLYPLDEIIRKRIEKLRKPYPKRGDSVTIARSATSREEAVQVRPRRSICTNA